MTFTNPCRFHATGEGSYWGEFPDFEPDRAHIYSMGDTPEEAEADAAEALACALEGEDLSSLPIPSELDAVSSPDGFVALVTASVEPTREAI